MAQLGVGEEGGGDGVGEEEGEDDENTYGGMLRWMWFHIFTYQTHLHFHLQLDHTKCNVYVYFRPVARIFWRGVMLMSNVYVCGKTRGVWGDAPPGNF